MSGVVFMVCVPSESKENGLYSVGKQKLLVEDEIRSFEMSNKNKNTEFHDKTKSKISDEETVKSIQHIPMISILDDILKLFRITNAVWYRGEGDYVQVVFPVESQEQCEAILFKLNCNNIGKLHDSTVSVLPCSVHHTGHTNNSKDESSETYIRTAESDENAWNKIVSSKNTRLTVDQIVETVNSRAILTFDFICGLLISSTICALGLVENSTVYLLSSMVMSPMMGPVMAATFGSVIRDNRLKKIGVQNEFLGLAIATFVGFCYGTVTCIITDKYGNQEWPTYEITSRGELRSLWIGCIIALLSGAAVALGILSDNIASLVGVAISTSLMPPAVNAGLLWSMANVYYFKGNSTSRYSSLEYRRHYSDSDIIELLILGAVSICLTLVNIVCIYFAAICIFKIKEVAPIASRDKQRRQFWKHDIKNARYNNTIQRGESEKVRDEYENFKNKADSETKCASDILHHSTDLSKENAKVRVTWHQSTWSHNTVSRPKLKDMYFHQDNLSPTPSTRRLSCLFKEGLHQSDCSEESTVEKNTKLVFTKSKTFAVTPCEGHSQTIMKPQMNGFDN